MEGNNDMKVGRREFRWVGSEGGGEGGSGEGSEGGSEGGSGKGSGGGGGWEEVERLGRRGGKW